MATIHLEDCPLCGGPGKGKNFPTPFRHGWVGCPECGLYINWTQSPREAVRKWNRRYTGGASPSPTRGTEM